MKHKKIILGVIIFIIMIGVLSIPNVNTIVKISAKKYLLGADAIAIVFNDGLKYELYNDGTAALIDGNKEISGEIEIPSQINENGNIYIVTKVSLKAFENYYYTSSITIPSSVNEIDCYGTPINLLAINVSEGNENYSSEDGVLFNKNKTSILRYPPAKEDITKYTIPNSVTEIASSAFENCSHLKEITMSDNLTSIGDLAFCNCGRLTEIILPDSLTTIGANAFELCMGLTEITIPRNVGKCISIYTFEGCKNLKRIQVDENNSYYSSEDGVLLNKDQTELLIYPPAKDDKIYVVPNNVTKIGMMTFLNCKNLERITMSNNITRIEELAFCNCTGLTEIELPESLTYIGTSAFSYCSGITRIEIPNQTKILRSYVFYDCTSLEEIIIPSSVTNMSASICYGCISLKNIQVDDDNSNYCSEDGVLFNKDKTKIIKYPQAKQDIKKYRIPKSVTEIENDVFYGCSKLDGVIILNKEINIGVMSFRVSDITIYGYKNSTAETVANNMNYKFIPIAELEYTFDPTTKKATAIGIAEGVTFEGEYAIVNEVINEEDGEVYSVTNIEDNVFDETSGLTSIEIFDGITQIGNIFRGCTGLEEIKIPSSVAEISEETFNGCTNLKDIQVDENSSFYSSENGILYNKSKSQIIRYPEGKEDTSYITPKNVQFIEDNAFNSCKNLTKVTLSNTVRIIGANTFANCENLKEIIIPKQVESIGNNAFEHAWLKTMYGYKDSIAEEYAHANNIPFIAIDVLTKDNIELSETTFTYDGTEKKPIITVVDVLSNTLTKDIDYTVTYSNNTNAGTAKVTIVGIGNYKGEEEILFTIEQADMEYIVQGYEGQRDGESHGITITVTKPTTGIEIKYGEEEGSYTLSETPTYTEIGTYTVYYQIKDINNNYKTITESKNVVITKKDIQTTFKDEIKEKIDKNIDYLDNINPQTSIDSFRKKIETNGYIEILDKDKKVITNETKISTGMKLQIREEQDGEVVKLYEIVVTGDIYPDGEINDRDILMLARYKVGFDKEKEMMNDSSLKATDINKDGIYASDSDLLKLAKILVKLDTLK